VNRIVIRWILLAGALLAPAASFAQVACTRAGLEAATDLYIAAQGKGDPSGMPLAMGLAYIENQKVVPIASGVIQKPMKIDHHRSLIDTATCQTFTEVIVTDKSHPYLIGTRLRVNKDKIVELESMVTQEGDWLFDADAYLKYSSGEDWGTIPAAKRDTRDTLVAAANAYLDAFLERNLDPVPWGYPCNRTEGGKGHTGKGTSKDSCADGVPAGVNIVARRFIVDETIGSVVVFCTFGVNGAPDSHLFRLENGKLRFVHTLTHLSMADFNARRGGQGKAPPTNQN
jgi:hypothetical protein